MPDDTTAVDAALAGLEPVAVWRHFSALARISRGSGNEAGVRAYVKAFAAEKGFDYEENEVGDVLLRVHASKPGRVIGLQAHMDMVCVAEPEMDFDFKTDPIRLKREGDSLRADGTTLGADNGIGIAYALALMEEAQGPMETLLTVDEEDGFTGVDAVAPGWLRAKTLINLDSEEEGYLTIASAGARDYRLRLPVERKPPNAPLACLAVAVDELKGGHSGMEIHRGRTNALKAVGRVLQQARELGAAVFEIAGGTASNVIPSKATAVVGLAADQVPEFKAKLAALQEELRTEEDPDLLIVAKPAQPEGDPLTERAADGLVGLLNAVPFGILVASPQDPSQPYVSNNLGTVKDLGESIELLLMGRSPSGDELEKLVGEFGKIAQTHGAALTPGKLAPGWEPDYDSPLLALFRAKYLEQYGSEAKVLEIHAGLECGALGVKYPGMDLISVGPDITGAHSTKEQVSVASTQRTFELVRSVLRALHATA